ncbi:MAG: hypothetical protein JWN14_3374 [Chthonomonadales bacterium]|nr:hypothetical protein [Chthonomonadales bacterium]
MLDIIKGLGMLALMGCVCVLFLFVPMTIGRIYGHGWGALTALTELSLMARLGIRPMPGFVQGAFCIVLTLVLLAFTFMEGGAFVLSLFHHHLR